MSLVMYVKPDCPYCQRARDFYNENGIEFIEYDAQNDKQRQKEMLAYTGGDPVVPAILRLAFDVKRNVDCKLHNANCKFLYDRFADQPV